MLALLAMAGGPVLSGCASRSSAAASPPAVAASRACPAQLPVTSGAGRAQLPDLTLSCLGAPSPVHLPSLVGRPLLVNLWASWCGPCQTETPRIQHALAALRSNGQPVPVVLGVDTHDDPGPAAAFLATQKVTWPVVVDPAGSLAAALRAPGLPVTLGLNAQGRVVYRHIGELRSSDVQAALHAVSQPVSPPTAGGTAG